MQEGKLAAELVSKTPWSEARDVWLKLGLLSVCHPDITQGELFVGCVFSCLSLSSLRSSVTGDEPCRVAAGDREPFLLSNPDGASTWKTFHLSCHFISLPSSLSFCVDLKGYKYTSDAQTEGVNLVLLFSPTFLFCQAFPYCRALLFLFLTGPFLFSVPPTHRPLPSFLPSLPLSDL